LKVHYNTVSEAYQDLVGRKWLSRQPGSKLVVGTRTRSRQKPASSLDELINRSIQRAKDMGYSLQELRERVRERLLAQPPDHILIVERDTGLREILRKEVSDKVALPVETCSPGDFVNNPGLAVGAQVVAPSHIIEELNPFVPQSRPCVPITYSGADEHLDHSQFGETVDHRGGINQRRILENGTRAASSGDQATSHTSSIPTHSEVAG